MSKMIGIALMLALVLGSTSPAESRPRYIGLVVGVEYPHGLRLGVEFQPPQLKFVRFQLAGTTTGLSVGGELGVTASSKPVEMLWGQTRLFATAVIGVLWVHDLNKLAG